MITHAYDLEMLRAPALRGTTGNHGWAFGLPPGITPAQWPLDPNTGYPMVHGFTLLLPEDYRCHGPDIAALSFFATPADQNDGGAERIEALYDAIVGDQPPANRELMAVWREPSARHPRLFRMHDILDYEYAVILLTQAEFDGPLCRPAPLGATLHLSKAEPPHWMDQGAGLAYFHFNMNPAPDKPVEEQMYFKTFGEIPHNRLDWNRALRWTPRANDPNAGKAPMDPHITNPADSGYQQPFYWLDGKSGVENYREQDWLTGHKSDHIGGTMRPVQNTPQMSPFYIEFEEYLGGYNFGGGNAQLDFRDMKFDWACG